MFHVEVRQFPHVARSFNLSEAELNSGVLAPWSRGEEVKLGERLWNPARAKLTVLEGPELRPDEMGLGRGWGNVTRGGEDVTERVLEAVRTHVKPAAAGEGSSAASAFKAVVEAQCATDRLAIHQVLWLANSRHPGWRMSERLALSEQAVWELLHEGRVQMLRRVAGDGPAEYAPAERSEWEPALLAWATWSDSALPRWVLVAAAD